MVFLGLADFSVDQPSAENFAYGPNPTLIQVEVKDSVEIAGVGWTGYLPVWFQRAFNLNVNTTTQIAGVGWTGYLPVWMQNFFGIKAITIVA
jgi:predicted esterase YcpF (UPF0227 family)